MARGVGLQEGEGKWKNNTILPNQKSCPLIFEFPVQWLC